MKYLFALFLTLASFGSAQADSRDITVSTVPFDFVIGNKTFTAGQYTISRISVDLRQVSGFRAQTEKQTPCSFPEHQDPSRQMVNRTCSSATKATSISWQRFPLDWIFIPSPQTAITKEGNGRPIRCSSYLKPLVGAQRIEARPHQDARVKSLFVAFFEPIHGLVRIAERYIDHGNLRSIRIIMVAAIASMTKASTA